MKFLSSERLSQHKYKTPEGYLICVDAILARTGKQTYRKNEVFADSNDDTEIEVDRKAEEVFSPSTLASFENKPVTVEHPDEDVNAGNYNELSVGFVRDVHRGVAEGQDVMLGTLVITDAQTIDEIENGEHIELSCGYDCDIIDEANPQQRNIRGNHVALCQQGRAGIARIVDSVKDADIFKVDVTSAEDRDVSRFITEAQNVGFTTEDKGYAIYLKNGSKDMLRQLKARTHTTTIKFVDSNKVDDSKYIVHFKHKNGGEDKDIVVEAKGMTEAVEIAKTYVSDYYYNYKSVKPYYGDSVKDAQSVMFKGENTFIFANKDMIPERTHYKGDVEYDGKEYYYHEGFESKRKYLVPIVDSVKDNLVGKNFGYLGAKELREAKIQFSLHETKDPHDRLGNYLIGTRENIDKFTAYLTSKHDSIKDDLVFGYTQKDLDLATEMLSKAETENEKKLLESLIAKIKYEMTNQEMRDASSTQETLAQKEYDALKAKINELEKDIDRNDNNPHYDLSAKSAEMKELQNKLSKIKKDFGYCIKDSKKFEISYVKDNVEYIQVVKASSLNEAIKALKETDND